MDNIQPYIGTASSVKKMFHGVRYDKIPERKLLHLIENLSTQFNLVSHGTHHTICFRVKELDEVKWECKIEEDGNQQTIALWINKMDGQIPFKSIERVAMILLISMVSFSEYETYYDASFNIVGRVDMSTIENVPVKKVYGHEEVRRKYKEFVLMEF